MILTSDIYNNNHPIERKNKKRAKQNDDRFSKLEKENKELKQRLKKIETNHLPHKADKDETMAGMLELSQELDGIKEFLKQLKK